MVIDTSAILSILKQEPDADAFAYAIERDPIRLVSTATMLEAWIVVTTRFGEAGGDDLDLLMDTLGVTIVPVTVDHLRLAREAFTRYGKGRHPAALNYGDCFVYGLARASGEPLLCKGLDFPQTDIRLVPLD